MAPRCVFHDVEPVVVTADRDARRRVEDVGVGGVEQVALGDGAAEERLVQLVDAGAAVVARLGQQLPVLRSLAGDVHPGDARPVVVLHRIPEPLEVLVLGQASRLPERPVVRAEDRRVALVAADRLGLTPRRRARQTVVPGPDPKRKAVPRRGRDDRVVGWRATVEVDVGERVRVGALDLHLDARPLDGFAGRVVHPAVPVPEEPATEAVVDVGRRAMHAD